MIDLGSMWGIARAEMRLTRRLVRFWVFACIAGLFCFWVFFWFWFIHWMFSAGSASAASAYPRFFMGAFGSNFVFFMLFGLVFLGYDVRARDTRERMVEVLDSLPCSNLELVLGKFLGIFVPCWIASLVITIIMLVASNLMDTPAEPWSMVNFLIFMCIPGFTFMLGLVFLISSVVRHRLVTALAGMGALVGAWAAGQWVLTLRDAPLLDVTGGYATPFASDIVPIVITMDGALQRIGFLLVGISLLLFAVATHPRKDDGSRPMLSAVAAVFLLVGAGLNVQQVWKSRGIVALHESWGEVHAAADKSLTPDLLALSGSVRIDPGGSIDMELDLRLGATNETGLDAALFTLNPGYELTAVTDASGAAMEFTHENGLLEVGLPGRLAPGDERVLHLSVTGAPDARFSYLDSAVELTTLKAADAQLLILGYDPLINESNLVALLPGVHWLPSSGPQPGKSESRVRSADFYDIDLTVDLPEGWVAAGPGRRTEETGAEPGRVVYRFAPGAPVPEVALIAGRYESRSVEIGGVTLEALVDSDHAAVFDLFDDAAGQIRDWLSTKLEEAEAVGLDYPYNGLTLVEVPNALRGYGGTWRMDSTLIQPAVILTRESGFPTARFARGWRSPDTYKDKEGGLPQFKRELLEMFFENDMNGGNPFIAAARSFFGFQTAAAGREELPLDFVFEDLTSRLVTEHRGYFSYRIFDREFGQDFQLAGQQMNNADRVGDTYNDVLINRLTSRPEVWEAVLEASLVDLDPWKDPELTIDILALKGGAMAQSMLDDLGTEKTGRFLAAVRNSNIGETFDRQDVLAAAEQVDPELDLAQWLDTWLQSTDLPGFTVSDVRVHRLEDGEGGTPRYQSLVTVRNGEQVPGLVKLEYRKGRGINEADRGASDPIRIEALSAVEVGLITAEPPTALRVAPYLALNRDPFSLSLPTVDEERLVDDEPFVGSRTVAWEPTDEGIVVDDLDEGFAVEESKEREMLRATGRGGDETLDQGLPVSGRLRAKRWSRRTSTTAYGKYRHTSAVIGAGDGRHKVIFSADLPESGPWELELYFAAPTSRAAKRLKLGTWHLTLVDESGPQEITFDAHGGESGWNSLGTFEVAGGEVRLMLSDRTDGDYVVADAIRWRRARGSGQVASR